jgi:phosphoribosylanthranilate isomerase
VKICCIESLDEAWMAIRHQASALGLVSSMPSGPGVIPEEQIIEIARAVPPGVATFLLTSEVEADAIVAQQRRCGTSTIQLCDMPEPGTYEKVRRAAPGIALVQVVHVVGEASLDEALEVAGQVDALLLDSGNPAARVKELGGTGRVHDWSVSRRICEASPVPVYLAGGLSPENVADAVAQVRPFGVDVCSGLRPKGRLDAAALASFMTRVMAGTEARLPDA